MINNLKKMQRGFTLIETLVAVLLLVIAIAGPLTVASRAFNSALVAKDQITAYYLAQDALEYVRFRRDNACLTSFNANPTQTCQAAGTWLSAFGTNCDTSCRVDTNVNSIQACTISNATSCLLNYDTSLKRYTHAAGTATKFKRYVDLDRGVPTAKETLVTVTVSWPTNATTQAGCPTNTRCVILQEYIYNWQ
jgi:prepilin-type N-terminal cleavage/methylation domain-containing protein